MKLSNDEMIFIQRMLPHFMTGKSPADAARAVLDDDARLLGAAFDRRSSHFVPTADERGVSCLTAEGKGDVIFSEMSRAVWCRFRAKEGA